jgi:predicted SAM-dependent methyltransferase
MDIYPKYAKPELKKQIIFEINSWIGRHFFKKLSVFPIPPGASKVPLLVDLGAGNNFTKGWIHVDFFRNRICKFWKAHPKKRLPDVETDLRFPLNCPSNAVDGVYTGHTLEHLCPKDAYQLLNEIYRILKPGCWLRINVPDLKLCVDYYNKKNSNFSYKFKVEAICNYTQNWGHLSAWDSELLRYALESRGFIRINEVQFGEEGHDNRLIKEEEVRKFETIVMEAQKPN